MEEQTVQECQKKEINRLFFTLEQIKDITDHIQRVKNGILNRSSVLYEDVKVDNLKTCTEDEIIQMKDDCSKNVTNEDILDEEKDERLNTENNFLEYLKNNKVTLPYQNIKNFIMKDIKKLCTSEVPQRENFAQRLENSAPFHLFYTTVNDSVPTHDDPLNITFQDLFDKSLGKITASLHINFVVDPFWLWAQYLMAGYGDIPILIINGDIDFSCIETIIPNMKMIKVKPQFKFALQNSKLMLFQYEDGSMRIVVSSVGLSTLEWHNRTQGIWVSPTCPLLENCNDTLEQGNGPTNFKKDLWEFIESFRSDFHVSEMNEWLIRIKNSDFSHINVFLITTIPGIHRIENNSKYGHLKVASLLSEHCTVPEDEYRPHEWNIIMQTVSIGFLGNESAGSWFNGELRRSFSKDTTKGFICPPEMCIIYPTKEYCQQNPDLFYDSICLSYLETFYKVQSWLKKYLYHWKSLKQHRDLSIPHIKTYCRVSPDYSKMAWFILTSANLSRAGWGFITPTNDFLCKQYEMGVLFLPKFVTGEQTFNIKNCSNSNENNVLHLPYDLPLIPYEEDDEPCTREWTIGILKKVHNEISEKQEANEKNNPVEEEN